MPSNFSQFSKAKLYLFELCDISDLVYNRTTQLLNGGLEPDNRAIVPTNLPCMYITVFGSRKIAAVPAGQHRSARLNRPPTQKKTPHSSAHVKQRLHLCCPSHRHRLQRNSMNKNCEGTGEKNTSPTTARENDQPPQVDAPTSARPVPPPAPSHGGANGNKVKPTKPKKSKQQPKKKRRKRRAQFVLKLYQFLQSGQHATIVSWYKDAFVVWKKQEFTEHILPMLYSHNNYSSFERQLNFNSFKKMPASAELPSKKRMKWTDPAKFKHRLFHQNASLEQINKISRTTSCHQTWQVQETRPGILIMRSCNSKMNNTISEVEGEV